MAIKYKSNKIQIEQNANIQKYKNSKIQILGVPIENQCVKGGGGCILVFLNFVLFVFCSICIFFAIVFCWLVVFCSVCIMEHLYFVTDSSQHYSSSLQLAEMLLNYISSYDVHVVSQTLVISCYLILILSLSYN